MAGLLFGACLADEDVMKFDHAGRTFAIYLSPDNKFHATDGLCTHENIFLARGSVMNNFIECPKHNGRFACTTDAAKGAPVCASVKTYPAKIEDPRVFINIA